jgi:hypothetical protein
LHVDDAITNCYASSPEGTVAKDRERTSKGESDPRRRVTRHIATTFGLLGATVGFFSGMSEGPITATLVPLLFALLTGGLGISFVKTDYEKETDRRRLSAAAVAGSTFACPCLLGAVYGISVRAGSAVDAFVPRLTTPNQAATIPLPVVTDHPLDVTARTLLLRTRLQLLGATDGEIRLLLGQYVSSANRMGRLRVRQELQRILAVAVDSRQRLNNAVVFLRNAGRAEDAKAIDDVARVVAQTEKDLGRLIHINDGRVLLTATVVRKVAERYDDQTESLPTDWERRRALNDVLRGTDVTTDVTVVVYDELQVLAQMIEHAADFDALVAEIDKVIELQTPKSDGSAPSPPQLSPATRPSVKN